MCWVLHCVLVHGRRNPLWDLKVSSLANLRRMLVAVRGRDFCRAHHRQSTDNWFIQGKLTFVKFLFGKRCLFLTITVQEGSPGIVPVAQYVLDWPFQRGKGGQKGRRSSAQTYSVSTDVVSAKFVWGRGEQRPLFVLRTVIASEVSRLLRGSDSTSFEEAICIHCSLLSDILHMWSACLC